MKLWNATRSTFLLGSSLTILACAQAENDEHHTEPEGGLHNAVAESSSTITEEPKARHPKESSAVSRSADRHAHGGAVLSIVSENDVLIVELESPLFNFLGFEYEPRSSDEKARVSEVEARLNQPESLFDFNTNAECDLNALVTKVSLFDSDIEDHGHDSAHQDHHDDHASSDDHKDVVLSYRFTCEAINKLKTVHVKVFQYFPNFTELELVYLGPTRQMSAELSSSRPIADLTR